MFAKALRVHAWLLCLGMAAVAPNAVMAQYGDIRLAGMYGDTLTPDLVDVLGLPPGTEGVFCAWVSDGSIGAQGGLRSGDVIVEANGRRTSTTDQLHLVLREIGDFPVLLKVSRAGDIRYHALPMIH